MFGNIKIGMRLALGFALLLILTAILGVISINSMETLGTQTTKLYEHPFRVTRALLESKVEVIQIVRSIRDAILAKEASDVDRISREIDKYEEKVYERIGVARQQFLGDKSEFDKLRQVYTDWRPVR
ncbi:MAG: methyl-accepting chemotaxis protein [Rhodospirillaceae bacterium]|nr:MAG: methyl-accepting chemotaxis protein [Rhodospirillaceae bacterium]